MKIRFFLISLFYAVLGVFQIYLNSQNWGVFANVPLLLAVLAALIVTAEFSHVLWYLLIAGIIMDMHSSTIFGAYLLSLLLTAFALRLLSQKSFTNRTFYSLLFIGLLGVIIFNLFFLSLSGLAYYFNLSDYYLNGNYFDDLAWQFLLMIPAALIIFNIINYLSKKFKPIFLK